MCGITGFIDYDGATTEQNLENASAHLQSRGGNGNGIIFEKHEKYTVGLANERLAIIDLSNKSLQPFTSPCGNYTLTFNGTIYNYIEIRQDLIKYGVIFNTLSDTEVLIESYIKWGLKMFEKLDGVFAFAILDRRKNQLVIARDAIGVKPLYIYKTNEFFAFSSAVGALFNYPLITKKINAEALKLYFRNGYFTGEATIFENIYSFKKGNATIIDLNSSHSYDTRITNLAAKPILNITLNETEIITTIEELITDSVLKRSIADTSVGVLLSSGYDSATVAAILQKNQAKCVKTFTLGFQNKNFDEAPAAKKIAAYLKTNHQEYYINNKQAAETVALLPEIFDQPMGDSGAIPLVFIAKNAAKDVKVLLGAEGGDELFGGYNAYRQAIKINAYANRIPGFLKPSIANLLGSKKEKIKEIFNATSLLNTYTTINSYFTYTEINTLLNVTHFANKQNNKTQNIKTLLAYDIDHYLPNDLLLKTDSSCMYFGVENRDALLKTNLVNYLKNLDEKWFIKDGISKYLLKKITHKYIPEKLMSKQKKGFSVPISLWLNTFLKPYVDEYLSHTELNKHNLFNPEVIFKIKNDFYVKGVATNAKKIWLLLQFQMWYNRWMN